MVHGIPPDAIAAGPRTIATAAQSSAWILDGPHWPNGTGHRYCCTFLALAGHILTTIGGYTPVPAGWIPDDLPNL